MTTITRISAYIRSILNVLSKRIDSVARRCKRAPSLSLKWYYATHFYAQKIRLWKEKKSTTPIGVLCGENWRYENYSTGTFLSLFHMQKRINVLSIKKQTMFQTKFFCSDILFDWFYFFTKNIHYKRLSDNKLHNFYVEYANQINP